MNPVDILLFLLPHDAFQYVFLTFILALTGYNIWGVRKKANPENWLAKWQNGTEELNDDDLDSEHGSVIEISQAVATAPEKLAEIMPGLLLVIGLLGTFLGLGLALNKASEILGHAKASGMDSAMSNMMEMMEGLGTKFKTSTWGIIGFLLFKGWSSLNNFEERRLRWTIAWMKKETEERRRLAADIESKRDEEYAEREKLQSKELVDVIFKGNEKLYKLFEIQNKDIIKTMKDSTSYQSDTLAETKTLNQNIGLIIINQKSMLKEFKMNSEHLKKMDSGIESMRDAVLQFIDANKASIIALEKSGINMSNSAKEIGVSAKELDKAVQSFQKKVSDVLTKIEENLSKTIQSINTDFNKNLTSVSKNLGDSTKSISSAVEIMSNGIKKTLDEVGGSLSKAIDVQKKAFGIFETTSQTLNKNIESVTGSLNKVMAEITLGLSAVSDKRQEMKQATDAIKKAIEHINLNDIMIEKTIASLDQLKVLPKNIESELKKVNQQLSGVNEKLQASNRKGTHTK